MPTTEAPTSFATALKEELANRELTSLDIAENCIARVEARETDVQAWAWFDPEHIRAEARRLDALADTGTLLGPLHGIPVGIKDVIDTAAVPTENGCSLDKGRIPAQDAAVVELLKAAGALIFGKTVTTELAFLTPGKTRNPLNLAHTPGGSSSGSAAAVADGMVPLAIGTQTGGSVIRPASFCGVFGYKPTFGAIPSRGVLVQSHSLDTVGLFARHLSDAALLADALVDMPGKGSAVEALRGSPQRAPKLALIHPPRWEDADPELKAGLARLSARLGSRVLMRELPRVFDDAAAQRAIINNAEMAHHFHRYVAKDASSLGTSTRAAIAEGEMLTAQQYLAALDIRAALSPALAPIFEDADVILCPSALGPAPAGLSSTGDSIFNGLWTMSGNPAITLPLLQSRGGLPMGVQLVGQPGEDARLFEAAHWLWNWSLSNPD